MKGAQGEKSWTKTQLVVFFVTILLSVDEINPIKIFLHVFPVISPWHVAVLSLACMIYIFLSDVKNMLYFMVKIFFHSILSIFFRNVEVIGRDNIPRHGPIIFTINHANQFIDAAMTLSTCQHKISYLMAEASWKRRIIGDIAWALDVVPVKRAQDSASPGMGTIHINRPNQTPVTSETDQANPTSTDGTRIKQTVDSSKEGDESSNTICLTIRGIGTRFTTELNPGDKLRPNNTAYGFKVLTIVSDSEVVVEAANLPTDFPFPNDDESLPYDILRRIPLNIVFQKVLDKLASGGSIGIFPEGGSHDRTDLLPLKIGITLIAYSALEQHGINIPIVPVGLNYFGAHRWRGRAVVEYGRPIYIDPATLSDFKAGDARRRRVCSDLLEQIEASMRSVLVASPDYHTLEMLHTARRLYQKGVLTVRERQDLSRRFAQGYKTLLSMSRGNPPKEWLDLQARIESYQNELKDLGLKDYQVTALAGEHLDEDLNVTNVDGDTLLSFLQLPYHVVHLLFLMALAAIPALMLNLPVGILAGLYAEKRRKKALANSKVKIRGYDVMLTEKVIFCIVMVPTLWVVYGLVMLFCTNLDGPAISLILLSLPLFSYMGIVVADAGVINWKDLRPYLMRFLPKTRRRLAALPETRKKLQKDLRDFVRFIGPTLGELYHGKDLDWTAIEETFRKAKEDEESKKAN